MCVYRATYTAQLYRVCISRMRYTVTDADGRTATGLQVFSTLGTQPIRHATARARGPKAQNRPDKTPGNSHVLSSAVLHGLPVLFLIRASCVGSSIGDAQIEEVRNPANLALVASMAKLSQRIQVIQTHPTVSERSHIRLNWSDQGHQPYKNFKKC